MSETVLAALLVAAAVVVLAIVIAMRPRQSPAVLVERLDALARANERLERELRGALEASTSAHCAWRRAHA